MKKIVLLFLFLSISLSCYATKVGAKVYYRNSDLGFASVETYLTKVEPALKEGYYDVELTSIIAPAGDKSAVGLFTYVTHYVLKEKDKIVLYESNYFSSKATTLVVSKISNNEIEFSTAAELLNKE